MPQPPEPIPSNHTPVIISKTQLANGVINVVCRCCDDPTTDSSHTIHILPGMTQDDVVEKIHNAHLHNAHMHEAANLANQYIEGIIVHEGNSSKAGTK